MTRRKWERENKHFRTNDYGDEKIQWLGKHLNPKRYRKKGQWGAIERGDAKVHEEKVKKVLVKLKAKIMDEMMQAAINRGLDRMLADAKKNTGGARKGVEKMRRRTEHMPMSTQQLKEQEQQRRQKLQEEEDALHQHSESSEEEGGADEWGGMMTGFGAAAAASGSRGGGGGGGGGGHSSGQHQAAAAASAGGGFDMGAGGWGAPGKPGLYDDARTPGGGQGQAETSFTGPPQGGGGGGGGQHDGSTNLSLVGLRQKTRGMTPETITPEFRQIPNRLVPVGKLPQGAKVFTRNLRYIPWPETVVKVNMKENAAGTSYMNASYVKGANGQPKRFIVTQAPQSGRHAAQGKGRTIDTLWSMIYDHKCPAVVMIEGSQPYIPQGPPGTKEDQHNLTITLIKSEKKSTWVVTTVEIKHRKDPRARYGARFSTGFCTRGCHWFPCLFT
jgi:hypothetical protein